jgi:hypothetical protein
MEKMILEANSFNSLKNLLKEKLNFVRNNKDKDKDYSIIIDGDTLKIILDGPGIDLNNNGKKLIEYDDFIKIYFLKLCLLCKTGKFIFLLSNLL